MRTSERPPPHAFRARERRPAIVGHRGVRGPKPENTLTAIAEAKRQGADAIEIDVRTCATGEVVVFHDPDLHRIAGVQRDVALVSWAELQRVDAGDGERIPRLADVLALARELGLGVNVEIKHDVPRRAVTTSAVARVLASWDRAHDLIVSSFDPAIVWGHRLLVPRLCHAQIIHESTYHDWALRAARLSRVDGVHTESSITVPVRVSRFVQSSFVNAWTINDPVEARRVFALGVSAVITDRPAEIAAAFVG